MLRNIKTDTSLTSLPGPPTHMLTLGWGEQKRHALAHQWEDFSNESTWTCLSEEAGVYYTRELLFSPVYSNEKSPCVLRTSANCTRDFMVAVSTEYHRRVMDRQTDERQTDILWQHSPHYAQHRAVEIKWTKIPGLGWTRNLTCRTGPWRRDKTSWASPLAYT